MPALAQSGPVPKRRLVLPASGTETMGTTQQENAALVRRFLVDVVAGGDTAVVDEFVASDLEDRNLVFEVGGDTGAAVSLGWRMLAAATVDVEIEALVAADDAVAVLATVRGVHEGTLVEIGATGASFEIAYVWFCRVENGRIAEIRSFPDGLGLLQQLDVPTPLVDDSLERTR